MNLKQLEHFVAIVEEGQITAAARRLHISQPPLSYELAQLERELDVELVRRSPKGCTPTDAGRLLYARAVTILAQATAAEREVSSVGKGLTGTLCVSVAASAMGLAPASRLAALAAFPDVRISLMEGSTPQVIEAVQQGIAEVGVVRTPFTSQGLRCRYAPSEPYVAVMPPALEAGSELAVSPTELADVPLVFDRRTASRLAATGIEMEPSCLTEDPRTTCAVAASGIAVGLVPRSLLAVCDTGDAFIKTVAEKALETRAAVIWAPDRALSPLAKRAVDLLGDLS